ncbi:MAG TPA: hypothetical protein VGP22_12350 [Albitalea sp.]|jgi:hypothetical protein|nr:hypothetical protein [Albitalea sp.]
MPAKILENNKVFGGAQHAGPRNFYLSWVPTVRGADRKGPPRCADVFAVKLEAIASDRSGRPIGIVVASSSGQQQAGTTVVGWGDVDWTDFVALITSEYAIANKNDPAAGRSGDFAEALALLEQAGADEQARALWAAVIEECEWRSFRVANRVLGEMQVCHALSASDNAEIIATSPVKTLERHVASAIGQLLAHDPQHCPHCPPGPHI